MQLRWRLKYLFLKSLEKNEWSLRQLKVINTNWIRLLEPTRINHTKGSSSSKVLGAHKTCVRAHIKIIVVGKVDRIPKSMDHELGPVVVTYIWYD